MKHWAIKLALVLIPAVSAAEEVFFNDLNGTLRDGLDRIHHQRTAVASAIERYKGLYQKTGNPIFFDAALQAEAVQESLEIQHKKLSANYVEQGKARVARRPPELVAGAAVQTRSGVVGEYVGIDHHSGKHMVLTDKGIVESPRPPEVLKGGSKVKLPDGRLVVVHEVLKASRVDGPSLRLAEINPRPGEGPHAYKLDLRSVRAIEFPNQGVGLRTPPRVPPPLPRITR